jgi:ASC-1-like (ASCH) protein
MLHEMKLTAGPFEKIVNGTKTLEVRLFDEKRQVIRIGDEIEFSKLPDLQEKVRVKVTALLRYRTFAEMFDDLPTALMGYPESKREYLRTSMYEVYSKEEEDRFGVLGIRMELCR